jgi:hypothetical protein
MGEFLAKLDARRVTLILAPFFTCWAGDPVPVVLQDLITGWALGWHVGFSLLEAEANWEFLEGKLCHEAVFWKGGGAADGRKSGVPVYLFKSGIGPALFLEQKLLMSWGGP